jgi:hypothetical protein
LLLADEVLIRRLHQLIWFESVEEWRRAWWRIKKKNNDSAARKTSLVIRSVGTGRIIRRRKRKRRTEGKGRRRGYAILMVSRLSRGVNTPPISHCS